jgi:hypothetical protein
MLEFPKERKRRNDDGSQETVQMQERMNQLGGISQPALHRLRSHSPILLLPKLGADGHVI